MVSRRDELLSSLDTAFNQLRTSFGGGLTHTSQPTTLSSTPTIPAFSRRTSSTVSGGPPLGGGVAVNRAPAAQADDALPTYQEARRQARPDMRRRTSSSTSLTRAGGMTNGPGGSGPMTSPSGPISTFTFRSGSGKVMLRLYAPTGRRSDGSSKVPVLVQGQDREIRGEVTVDLGSQGEPVSEIRVKCKGVVKTLVIKTKGSGASSRIPVVDENTFLQSDRTLYVPAAGVPADHRLTGAHSWSFTFTLPPSIPSFTHSSSPSTPIPLPPSFALTSASEAGPTGLAGAAAGMLNGGPEGITEWASVKYYLKLTIAKKGLLRLNERLFAPFVLLSAPIQSAPSLPTPSSTPPTTPTRGRLASHRSSSSTSSTFPLAGGIRPHWAEVLDRGQMPLGPAEDPGSWTGRKVRKDLVGGVSMGSMLRGSKKVEGWYEMITLLPNPPIFNRRAPVPYYLKITASHPGALDNFPLGIIDVVIFQRVTLVASGVTGVHENPIGRGTTMPDGGRDGIIATRHEWTKKLKGDIKLDAGAVPNFVCPNITVEYFFVATVRSNNGNGTQCVLPVKLVSSSRKRGASTSQTLPSPRASPGPGASTSAAAGTGSPGPSTTGAGAGPAGTETEVDLPPSYFEVQEMDRAQSDWRPSRHR